MKSMKFIQIQAMFLLIDLAERIFLDADGVFRGLPPEGWYLPEWIGEIRSSVFLCLVIALYAGDYLICRTGGGPSGENVLRKHGILWALFFYLPYLLYGCALDIGFLLLGAGVFSFEDGVCRLDGREAVSYAGRTPEGERASGAGKTKPPVCVLRPGIFCRRVVSFALAGYREPAASDLYRHRLAAYAGIYPHLANIPSPHAVTRPYGL